MLIALSVKFSAIRSICESGVHSFSTGLDYPDGKSASYTFDGVDRLKQVSVWDTSVTGYSYDAAGRQVSVSLPNGVTVHLHFQSRQQLVSVSGAGTTVSYGYNGQGDRVSQTAGITTTTYTLDTSTSLSAGLAAGLTLVPLLVRRGWLLLVGSVLPLPEQIWSTPTI